LHCNWRILIAPEAFRLAAPRLRLESLAKANSFSLGSLAEPERFICNASINTVDTL
jgi:hypothetical protein